MRNISRDGTVLLKPIQHELALVNALESHNSIIDHRQTLVIDDGSSLCKAGFAGEEVPRSVFPSVIGHRKYFRPVAGGQYKDLSAGDEAIKKRGMHALTDPIERRIVINGDDIEKIWHHIFDFELHVDPAKYPVCLTYTSLDRIAHRENMTQIQKPTKRATLINFS
jgi:actin